MKHCTRHFVDIFPEHHMAQVEMLRLWYNTKIQHTSYISQFKQVIQFKGVFLSLFTLRQFWTVAGSWRLVTCKIFVGDFISDQNGGFVLNSRQCPTDIFQGTFKLEYSQDGTTWTCNSSPRSQSSVTVVMGTTHEIQMNSCYQGSSTYCKFIGKFKSCILV